MCVMSVSGSNAARAFPSSRKSTDRKSMSRPLGSSGLRRETPTTFQPAARNLSIAATPSRPLAPVTSTFFGTILLRLVVLMIPKPLCLMRSVTRRSWLCGRCVGLEPLRDVGRGIAVEGPIEIFSYVADVRRREDVLQLAEGVIWSQRLHLEYVDRGRGDPARLQRFDQSHLVDDRTTRCVDESRRRLHQGELGCPDQPFGTTAQDEMDCHDVGPAEQRLLVHEGGTGGAGFLLSEVLAPGDHLHAEGEADARHFSSNVSQPDDTQASTSQVCAEARLPSTGL